MLHTQFRSDLFVNAAITSLLAVEYQFMAGFQMVWQTILLINSLLNDYVESCEAHDHDTTDDEPTATVLQADSLAVTSSDAQTEVTTVSDSQSSKVPHELATMTIRELKAYAKELHVPRYSRLNKSDLQDAIVRHLIDIA